MQAAAAHLLLLQRGARPVLRFTEGSGTLPVACRTSISRQTIQQSWPRVAVAQAAAAAASEVKTTAGSPHTFYHAPATQLRGLQQQQWWRRSRCFAAVFLHTCSHQLLMSSSCSKGWVGRQGAYMPISSGGRQRWQNIWLLQQQQQKELQPGQLLGEVACQRDLLHQHQQRELPRLLRTIANGLLRSSAELPATILDKMLPPLLRQLHVAAAQAACQKQPVASALLQRLTRDLFVLNSHIKQGESHDGGGSTSSGSAPHPEKNTGKDIRSNTGQGNSSSSTSSNSTNNSNDQGGDGTRGPRGPGQRTAPESSTRRVPLGFEAFYPKEALKQREGSGSSSNSGSGRLPFVPPTGGALQHLLLRMCIWLGIWVFALSLLSRVVEPQLSLQEFLSSYVARGLVEKVVVVGDRGRCTAVVRSPPTAEQLQAMEQQQQHQMMLYIQHQQQTQQQMQQAISMQQYQQQQHQQPYDMQQQPHRHHQFSVPPPLQQPKLTDMLPRKQIVRFRTGLTPESFIEKMEQFQASLGIHPKDFLPIYVEEGWNLSLGDLLASAFFFLIMATIARDFLMGGAVNRCTITHYDINCLT